MENKEESPHSNKQVRNKISFRGEILEVKGVRWRRSVSYLMSTFSHLTFPINTIGLIQYLQAPFNNINTFQYLFFRYDQRGRKSYFVSVCWLCQQTILH